MLSYIFIGLLNLASAETPEIEADATIIVEARRNMVVYVEDPIVINNSEKISANFNSDSIVGYVNSHARLGKVKNQRGIYEPVTMHTEKIEVYDSRTISYAYSGCNYTKDALSCGIQNDHYTVRTNISVNNNEIVVRMTLYNSNALIVSSSSRNSREIVSWIRQQEINMIEQTNQQGAQQITGAQNCTGVSCNGITQTQPLASTTTVVNMPKEELPLKFAIPPELLDRHFHQASIGLFANVKLD